MKRGLAFIICLGLVLVLSFSLVSALSSNAYKFPSDFVCSDFGLECGEINIFSFEEDYNPYSIYPGQVVESILSSLSHTKSCGVCEVNSEYCFHGKCISKSSVGDCERPESFDKDCSSIKIDEASTKEGVTDQSVQCALWGCGYNSQTKKCSGTISPCSEFIGTYCSVIFKGEFNEETKICNNVPLMFENSTTNLDMIEVCLEGKLSNYGCEPNNLDKQLNFQYKPSIHLLNKNVANLDNLIYLTDDDFKTIENGGSVSISILMLNSGLPEGTPVSFIIYDQMDEPIRAGENVIHAIVDEQGDVNAEWLVSKEDISSLHPDYGRSRFTVSFIVNGVSTALFINSEFKVKTGECSGTSSCNLYSKEGCLIAQALEFGCSFDYQTNSCEGENKISCESFEFRDECKLSGCSWKADSLWEAFTSWLKGLFGA